MEKDSILSLATEQVKTLISDITDEEVAELTNEMMLANNTEENILYNQSKTIMNMVVDLKELMMMYACAMKEVRTKLEILNTEYSVRNQRNPINSITTRVKRFAGIMGKLERQNIPFSIVNIENNIHDIAGVRVICSYVDDIYIIAEALKKQSDIELIAEKDYIANPKPNGYRSLHLIISVPVFFSNRTLRKKVEVQIRTIAMDFWATLEHQMKYRQQLKDEEKIAVSLRECADIISVTDSRMLAIRKQIEANVGDLTSEEILLEKISKIDLPIV